MQITTERLEIRPFEFGDWPALKRVALDFQASEYRIYDHAMPTGDEKLMEAAQYFESTGLWFSVFVKDCPEMIGYVCFYGDGDRCDLGYCFHSSAHGCGYAFESCSALMDHIRKVRSIRKFTAGTALANLPSVKLLARLGFELVGMEEVCFYEGCAFIGGSFEKPT